MKKAASDIPSPKRDLSSVKTFSLKEQKQIKLDPLVYEDPLLSSSSASPSTRNVTERERQDKIEKIEKFVSSVEKVKKKEETSSDENTKEEVGNLPEGFFDDSGCAFEWEGELSFLSLILEVPQGDQ